MLISVAVPWREGIERQPGGYNRRFFSNFGRHIFGTFKVKADIIMLHDEMLYRLSSDPKMLDFE